MSSLADITARRIAAEDRHSRVFAIVCQRVLPTPGGADLVTGCTAAYRDMERLRREESEMIANGRIEDASLNKQL